MTKRAQGKLGQETMIKGLFLMPPKMKRGIEAKAQQDGCTQSEIVRRALLLAGVYEWESIGRASDST